MLVKNLVMILLGVFLTATLLSGCMGHSPEDRANFIVHRIKNELDLNDTQMAKLEGIKNQWLENQKAQKPMREAEANKVIAMVRSDKLDVTALKAMIKDHEDKINDFSPKLLDSLADFHASLTPQQREKMATRMEELKKHFSHD